MRIGEGDDGVAVVNFEEGEGEMNKFIRYISFNHRLYCIGLYYLNGTL